MSPVEVSPDATTLARTVATALVEHVASVQAEGRVPAIALTGGTIALEVYRAVPEAGSDAVDWTQVDFWWGDERYVAADSGDRNDRAAGLAMLDALGVDPARVHAMPAADEFHDDVAAAAAAYTEELRAHGSGPFDLVLLGLGPDGHVASLFPGFAQLDVDDVAALPVTDSPKPPPERITLTFGALNQTHEVWFLVSGQDKADAVARALADEGSVRETPARGIVCDRITWYVDQAAAASL